MRFQNVHDAVQRVRSDAVAVDKAALRKVADLGAVGGDHIPQPPDAEHFGRDGHEAPAGRDDDLDAAFQRFLQRLFCSVCQMTAGGQRRAVQVQCDHTDVVCFRSHDVPFAALFFSPLPRRTVKHVKGLKKQ